MNHLTVSFWGAAEWALYAAIVLFLMKSLAAWLAEKDGTAGDIGKALAYIYN